MNAPRSVANSSKAKNNTSLPSGHPEGKRSKTPETRRTEKKNAHREKPKRGNGDGKSFATDDTMGRTSISRSSHRPETKKKHGQSCLRVKTQREALQQKGIRRGTGKRKTAKFSMLEVREHPIILGDNPACTEGPPLTIDWAYDPTTKFVLDIDTFEKIRGNRRKNRELILSRSSRERCVHRAGFTSQDVANALRQLRKDRHSRLVSAQQVGMDDLFEAKEKFTQGFKKLLFKKSSYEMSLKEARASIPNHGNHP